MCKATFMLRKCNDVYMILISCRFFNFEFIICKSIIFYIILAKKLYNKGIWYIYLMKNLSMNRSKAAKYLCVAAVFFTFPILANAQIISTIAGNGTGSYSGDGGAATAAGINYPTHTAMDASGNLYFGDFDNYRIRKMNSAGTISTYAGNGTYGSGGDGGQATASSNTGPAGIALDAAGNLYFADYHNARIRKVATSGIITTIAGTGTAGFSGDGGPATAATINTPWGVTTDATGNIYFCDRYNHRIRKINSAGIITTIAGTGIVSFSGDGGPATAATLHEPVDLVFDQYGNLFFSDFLNNRIRKISTAGVISTIAGNGVAGYSGDGVAATASELNNPVGVGVDPSGNVYVGDYFNNRVRKINPSGIISTIAGTGVAGYSGDGGQATAAQLNTPYGVAVCGTGNIYICDAFNYRIRMIGIANNPPFFRGGHIQDLVFCVNESTPSVAINALLAVEDTDAGQTETWSLLTPPSHGIIVAAFSTISTGSTLTPTGLIYTPTSGYTGPDMFKVMVTDGIAFDTTTINVTVDPALNAGTILGLDSICPGASVTLSETVSGGIWSTSNSTISTVNSVGKVTGISPGLDTIIYTIINSCGIVSAIKPFYVRSYLACHTGIDNSPDRTDGFHIYPNPSEGAFTIIIGSAIDEPAAVTISDLSGKIMNELNVNTNVVTGLSLNLPAGMYFLKATTLQRKYNAKICITH